MRVIIMDYFTYLQSPEPEKKNREGKQKVRLGFRSLPKPQAKLEDSASVEGFLSVWGFNGDQRRFVVANDGCG